MTEQPRTLTIDQALFGYADGHRQLAASLKLTPGDAYDLAARSDLASSARLAPKASYIGGFTLKDSGAFAYIKTWPAPEMPRPGCVWSHILILPRSFLVGQVDLGILQHLFKKPAHDDRFDDYANKVKIQRLAKDVPADTAEVERIISAYYGSRQLLYHELPGNKFERALLAVWSQQWPKLRSNFVFRTVFDTPGIINNELIISIAAPNARREIPAADEFSRTDWLSAAVADAVSPTITQLRRFLWRYGKDVARPRSAFEPLIRLYLAVERGDKADRFTISILRSFPKSLDGATLKRDLLGIPAGAPALVPRVDGCAFVDLAIRLEAVRSGLAKPDELSQAIVTFSQEEVKHAAIALGESKNSSSLEEILIKETVMRFIEPQMLADEAVARSFVVDALRVRPELIEGFDTDRLDETDVIVLLDIAPDRGALRRLLRRLLTSSPSEVAAESLGRFVGDAFVEAVRLSMVDMLQQGWREFFLRASREAISKGLPELNGPREVIHAIALIDFSTNVDETPCQFADAARRSGPKGTDEEGIALDAYLLILSLKRGLSSTMPIVADVLPRLRFIALEGGFTPRIRALLDEHLPSLSDDWDLNKRLQKILRRGHRDGYDISEALRHMQLADTELSYILDKDKSEIQSVFQKLFWPW